MDCHDADRRCLRLRRTTALAALVLIAATWPLWTGSTGFPQVPLFGWATVMPHWVDGVLLATVLGSLAAVLMEPLLHAWSVQSSPRLGRGGSPATESRATLSSADRLWRAALLVFAAATAALVILNQLRLQPWAYQFVLIAAVLALGSAERAVRLLRVLVIGIYVWSAVSKFDASFIDSYGQYLVSGLLNNFGLTMDGWSAAGRRAAAALLPAGELLVAAGLTLRPTRRAALWLSVVLHLALLAALGPLGLDHRPGVLIWNVFFVVQNVALFGPWRGSSLRAASTSGVEPRSAGGSQSLAPSHPCWRRNALATAIVAAALLLPLLEPWGSFDVWPSWGVYASRPGRMLVFVRETARGRLPDELQPFVEPPRPLEEWCRVRIDRWSLAAVRAPLPPQERVHVGVALALARRHNLGDDIRVIVDGPADRWTGERASQEFVGRPALFALARTFRLNAMPR